MGLDDLAGTGIDHVLGKAKAKRKAAIRAMSFDGDLAAERRKRSMLEEDREHTITDPDSPHYRPPEPDERPSPRAQWDEARACWVEWDKGSGEWVEVTATEG